MNGLDGYAWDSFDCLKNQLMESEAPETRVEGQHSSLAESSSPFSPTDFFSILRIFTKRTLTGPVMSVKSETTIKAPQRCIKGVSE